MLEMSVSSTNISAYSRWRQVANSTFHNSVIQVCPLLLDVSFQFVDIWDLATHGRRRFRAYNIMSYYTFHDFYNNDWQSWLWLFNNSLKYTRKCVHGSICHFKFSKVVLAHISCEVGIICIVFLCIYFRTCLLMSSKSVHIWQTQSKK